MTQRPALYGEESGGLLHMTDFSCSQCQVSIEYRCVDKLGHVRENWSIAHDCSPQHVTRSAQEESVFPVYSCVRCDAGQLLAAVVIGHTSDVSPRHGPIEVRYERSIMYLCNSCRLLYVRVENGSPEAPIVIGWNILVKQQNYAGGGGGLRQFDSLEHPPHALPITSASR